MSLDEVLKCGSNFEMSPPWATTSSRFWVVCARASRTSGPGSAAKAPAAAAPLSRWRRVTWTMTGLLWIRSPRTAGASYMGLLGAGCQGAARSCHNPRVATADVVVIGGGATRARTPPPLPPPRGAPGGLGWGEGRGGGGGGVPGAAG